ncbi:hypothetical protein HK099_004029 [Clydaea vesicula]|uniref:RRM domain-containing protein n=1 Tax=Clydaea vesicula TaxID=447962 RepID=A0AAD5U5H3_9FUNG|nr:hypothetical protein HK099_004029 [Clydaea vesicula]
MPPKKSKGVKLDLAFGNNWADDVDDLPTAPAHRENNEYEPRHKSYDDRNERRSDKPKLPVPDNPPYTAFIGNLSFDTTEKDLETLFRDLNISHIKLIRADDKPKGFGYIEFGERESLVDALKFNGESVRNRPIKIDVAEQKQHHNRGGGRGGDRDGGRPERREYVEDAKFATDWRSGAEGPLPPRDNFSRGDRGGFGNRQHSQDRGFGGGRQNSRERGGYRNQNNRDGGDRNYGGDRDRARGNFKNGGEARPGGERKKLALLPRTAGPLSPTSSEQELSNAPKVNPFGAAKPRDDTDFQKQFEERQALKKQKELEEKLANEEANDTNSKNLEQQNQEEKVERGNRSERGDRDRGYRGDRNVHRNNDRQGDRNNFERPPRKEQPISKADEVDEWTRGVALEEKPKPHFESKKSNWGDNNREDKKSWNDNNREDKKSWGDNIREDKKHWGDNNREDKKNWGDNNREDKRRGEKDNRPNHKIKSNWGTHNTDSNSDGTWGRGEKLQDVKKTFLKKEKVDTEQSEAKESKKPAANPYDILNEDDQ